MLARIYDEMVESVDHLSREEQAKVIYAYVRYQLYGEEPNKEDINVYSMFRAKKLDLDSTIRDITASVNNWKKGWRTKKTFKNLNEPKTNLKEPKQNLSISWEKRIENIYLKENEKKSYLENVYLKDSEYNKLVEEYGKQIIDDYILKLSTYMIEKWKVYTDHYRTILKRLAKWNVKKKSERINEADKPYDFEKDKIFIPVRKRQWEIQK